jgi:Tfp pilus assembly protein PilN
MSEVFEDTVQDAGLEVATGPRVVVMPSVNLLPPEIGERKALLLMRVRVGSVALLAAAAVFGGYTWASNGVSSAQTDLNAASSQTVTLQHQMAKYSDVTTTKAAADASRAALAKALGNDVKWSSYMNDLSITLPGNVWLGNVSFTETPPATPAAGAAKPAAASAAGTGIGTISIQGNALTYADVAVWLETMAKEKGFSDVWLSSGATTKIGTEDWVAFSGTATLTADALSHRYDQAGN